MTTETNVPEFYLDEAVCLAMKGRHPGGDNGAAIEVIRTLHGLGLIKIKPRPNFVETLAQKGISDSDAMDILASLIDQGFEIKQVGRFPS